MLPSLPLTTLHIRHLRVILTTTAQGISPLKPLFKKSLAGFVREHWFSKWKYKSKDSEQERLSQYWMELFSILDSAKRETAGAVGLGDMSRCPGRHLDRGRHKHRLKKHVCFYYRERGGVTYYPFHTKISSFLITGKPAKNKWLSASTVPVEQGLTASLPSLFFQVVRSTHPDTAPEFKIWNITITKINT